MRRTVLVFLLVAVLVLSSGCLHQDADCAKDCQKAGMDFMHYTGGGLGQDACTCINSTTRETRNVWGSK